MLEKQEVRPQISLELYLDKLFTSAAKEAFGEVDFDATVRPSKHGDYQVNGALPLGKSLSRSPREVANEIVKQLNSRNAFTAEIAGPGFINCTFSASFLEEMLERVAEETELGIEPELPQHTYVVDYSSPNVAKNMHVGHLRTTIIGDTLVRLMMARHNKVDRQNHLGDWGTQFGMLIEFMIDTQDPDTAAKSLLSDLDSLYRQARAKFDSDENFAKRSRERVVLLQGGDPYTLNLWHKLIDTSKQFFRKVYKELGVLLTDKDDRGESFYNDMLDETVKDLETKDLVSMSQGALCAFPPGFVGRDGNPFAMIVRKKDGGYGYFATDLATLRYSVDTLKGDRLVYVTDARQSQHFAMVFAVARQAGWINEEIQTIHVGYGTIMGADNKPFKTRSGEVVPLMDLVNEAIGRAKAVINSRVSDLSEDERSYVAKAVGIGALKWADLKNEHGGNYVFDFDRMLAFNGNTGPYVQYASTRAKSVLRKAQVGETTGPFVLKEESERQLALHLPEFATAVHRALADYQPHQLCSYLFELAERFTTFYENCPVLTAEPEIKQSRLALCSLTSRVLDKGLDLLGIQSLERM